LKLWSGLCGENTFQNNRFMQTTIHPKSEEMLWAKEIRNGNKSAFTKLFDSYYEPLCQYAYRYCNGDIEVVEDVVQEVFVRIWQKRDTWNPQIAVRSYLYRSVHNQAITNIRKKRFETPLELNVENSAASHDQSPLENLQNDEIASRLKSAIALLPERRRQILLLRINHDMSYKEIAEMLNISVNTVDTQLRRALKLLRDQLRMFVPAMEAA